MKIYSVKFTKSANKEFSQLSAAIKQKIIDAIELISTNPYSELLKVKKLKGAPSLYRVRIGDYRVVYEVKKDVLVIVIIKIGHRKEVYRHL